MWLYSGLVSSTRFTLRAALSSVCPRRVADQVVLGHGAVGHAEYHMDDVVYLLHAHRASVRDLLGVYTGSKDNCLCINRREKGLHNNNKGREDLGRLMTVWKDEYIVFPKDIVRLHWDGLPMGNRLY